MPPSRHETLPPSWLGVLPLGFFVATLLSHVSDSSIWTVLWMCNLCNLILAAGLFLKNLRLIWVATLWLVPGVPLWLWHTMLGSAFHWHSIFTHPVAAAMSIWILRDRLPVLGAWLYAGIFGIFIQLFCHLFTPPEFNINVSHATYKGLPDIFASYEMLLLSNIVMFSIILYLIERILTRFVALRPLIGRRSRP